MKWIDKQVRKTLKQIEEEQDNLERMNKAGLWRLHEFAEEQISEKMDVNKFVSLLCRKDISRALEVEKKLTERLDRNLNRCPK